MVEIILNEIPEIPKSEYHCFYIVDEAYTLHVEVAKDLTEALEAFMRRKFPKDDIFYELSGYDQIQYINRKTILEIIYVSVDYFDNLFYQNRHMDICLNRLSTHLREDHKEILNELQAVVNGGNVEEILDFKQRFYNANKENN